MNRRLRSHRLHATYRLRHSGGFTYLSLLILIAILALVSTATLQMGLVMQRHAAEEELLLVGAEIRSALISYANATPIGQKRKPTSLQELLKDPRYPTPRRHLRKLYADPITGEEEWGVVDAPDGSGIMGIYSLSSAQPIKIGNFPFEFQAFKDKTSYRDWQFMSGIN